MRAMTPAARAAWLQPLREASDCGALGVVDQLSTKLDEVIAES